MSSSAVLGESQCLCCTPLLQPLVDMVVPSASVRVLRGLGRLLDLCKHDEIVLGRCVPERRLSVSSRTRICLAFTAVLNLPVDVAVRGQVIVQSLQALSLAQVWE